MNYKRKYKKSAYMQNQKASDVKKKSKFKVLIILVFGLYFFNYIFNAGSIFYENEFLSGTKFKKIISFCEDAKGFIINKASGLDKIGKITSRFCYSYLGGKADNNIKAQDEKIEVFKENKKDDILKESIIHKEKTPLPKIKKDEFSPILPVNAEVSSPFGERIHPVTSEKSFHTGVDFKVDKNTDVLCISDGVVIKSDYDIINGNHIIIEHNDKYKSAYLHLEKLMVNKGDKVTKGEIIALSGSTGRATGPHLHFEIKEFDKPTDPFSIIK